MTKPEADVAGPSTNNEHSAPGHWVLAKMGKRVLRPGGIELTRRLIAELAPTARDRVVELGPGIGRTAELLLAGPYLSYTGVEPNPQAREALSALLRRYPNAAVVPGSATDNDLGEGCADAQISEAMLTMQTAADKAAIAARTWHTLAPGGRWAIHELCLRPDDVPGQVTDDICKVLSRTIRVGARPLTTQGWQEVFTNQGFEVTWTAHAPMRLVEPSRIIADEGLLGALRFFNNVRRNPAARARILAMRKVFRAHSKHLCAVAMVLRKPTTAN